MSSAELDLSKHGRQLITRQEAKVVRNRILNMVEAGEAVVVDFSGVELMTPSFADECFGRLIEEYGERFFRSRVRLKGASEETKHLVSVVLANRTLSGRSETTKP